MIATFPCEAKGHSIAWGLQLDYGERFSGLSNTCRCSVGAQRPRFGPSAGDQADCETRCFLYYTLRVLFFSTLFPKLRQMQGCFRETGNDLWV